MSVDKSSPRYFAQHWRNIPQEKLDVLEEFMAWYEMDYLDNPYEQSKNELKKMKLAEMQRLIDEFLEINPIKAKEGEKQMLEEWIKAAKH